MRVSLPFNNERVGRDPRIPSSTISETGVYFPTVCQQCHSRFSMWDEALKKLSISAAQGVPIVRKTASALNVRVRSDHIALSILAHMLTSRFITADSVFETSFREMVLGVADIGETKSLYLYITPYGLSPAVFIMHEFVAPLPGRNDPRVASVIKFGPLAFLVCDEPIPRLLGIDIRETLRAPKDIVHVCTQPEFDANWPRTAPYLMSGMHLTATATAEPA